MNPDILSYDKIDWLAVSVKALKGCRSCLQGWRYENENDVTAWRNKLGVVTVNIPRIALEAVGNKEKFWEIFNERIEIANDTLAFRV